MHRFPLLVEGVDPFIDFDFQFHDLVFQSGRPGRPLGFLFVFNLEVGFDFCQLGFGAPVPFGKQTERKLLDFRLKPFVALGLGGLPLERFHLAAQLLNQIRNSVQVQARGLEFAQGLVLSHFEFQHPRRFFYPYPPVLRFRSHDILNLALLNYGQHLGADADIQKQIGDVFQAARDFVDVKFTVPGPVVATGDFDVLGQILDVGDPQSRGNITQGHGDFGPVEGLARLTAVEDEIRDAGATQGFGTLLADDPANGVGNVAFAATIGTHDRREPLRKIEPGEVHKRLESNQFQIF